MEGEPSDEQRIILQFRRRRRWLVPFFLLPVLAGVALVSVGMELSSEAYHGFRGFTWAMGGLLVLAAAAVYLRWASRCPSCGRPFPVALLQGQKGDRCPSCGVQLT